MSQAQSTSKGIISFFQRNRMNWLLILIPISIAVELLHLPDVWIFISAAAAIIPLASLIGDATEQLAIRMGPGLGGLLNATFGNATELIISLFALKEGLHVLVKASITGSIISNILLVLGMAMLFGGWKRTKQAFSRTAAGASAAMLFLAVVALVMPAVFDMTIFGSLESREPPIEELSIAVSVVLILTYIAGLLFSIKTRQILFAGAPAEEEEAEISIAWALLLLGFAVALTALESEYLTTAVSNVSKSLGLSQLFIGVIIIAIIGNAAEHYSAVVMAIKNRMDLAVTIATASSTQIALFVAPLLVFASLFLGKPLSLIFNAFEITSIALSVIALSVVSLDGESNWFEGLQLIAVYVVMAVVFYFIPVR